MIDEQRQLVRWYRRRAQLADRKIMGERNRTLNDLIGDVECPGFIDEGDARSWFAHNRRNLIAIVELATSQQWHFETWSLVEAMSAYFISGGGNLEDAERCYSLGVSATKSDGNPSAQARLQLLQGQLLTDMSDYDRARTALDEAVHVAEGLGDLVLEGVGYDFTGRLFQKQGQWRSARQYFILAVENARKQNELRIAGPRTLAYRLRSLAQSWFKLGQRRLASQLLDEARDLLSEAKDWRNAVVVEIDSARLYRGSGESKDERYASAIRLGLDIGLELSNSDLQWYEWYRARDSRDGVGLGFSLARA